MTLVVCDLGHQEQVYHIGVASCYKFEVFTRKRPYLILEMSTNLAFLSWAGFQRN